jgi:pilus biogenesis lipoprotein CpaD
MMMMGSSYHARWLRLLPALAAMTLAACEDHAISMGTLTGPMPAAPPPIEVREQQRHVVLDLARPGQFSAAEWEKVQKFLAASPAYRADLVYLTISGNAAPWMTEAVSGTAVAVGIPRDHIAVAHSVPRDPRITRLELTARATVPAMPNCPQTQHVNIIDGDNLVDSDWGCSFISDLELQVVNPRDLVQGQSGGETDSVIAGAAINRNDTDKLKKLLPGPTTGGAPTGAAQ